VLDLSKFLFIVLCFLVSLYYRKPTAMFFTMAADFFLVYLPRSAQNDAIGVTVFCLAHICYAVRFSGSKKTALIVPLFALPAFAAMKVIGGGYLEFISAVYAQCFLMAVIFAVLAVKNKNYTKKYGIIILTGLALFVLCDINVLFYNIGTGAATTFAFWLIWLFYAPSQLLLALSCKANRRDALCESA
jgi:hypothetical protein